MLTLKSCIESIFYVFACQWPCRHIYRCDHSSFSNFLLPSCGFSSSSPAPSTATSGLSLCWPRLQPRFPEPLQVLRLLGVWKAMTAAGSNAGGKLHPCWRVWAASASLHCGCLRAHPHDAEQRIKPAGRNETQGGGARQHLLIWLRSWKRCRRRPKAWFSGVPALETAWGARRRPAQRRSSSSTGGPARSCWTSFIALKQVKMPVSIRWRCSGALSIYLSIHLSIYLPIYLSTYLPIYLYIYLSIYLPIYLPNLLSNLSNLT